MIQATYIRNDSVKSAVGSEVVNTINVSTVCNKVMADAIGI